MICTLVLNINALIDILQVINLKLCSALHKPRRFVIKSKANVNFCTISIRVSIHIYFLVYLFFCLPNKLYIIIIIIIIK